MRWLSHGHRSPLPSSRSKSGHVVWKTDWQLCSRRGCPAYFGSHPAFARYVASKTAELEGPTLAPNCRDPLAQGCTDTDAFNYDPRASIDDNSCIPKLYGCMVSSRPAPSDVMRGLCGGLRAGVPPCFVAPKIVLSCMRSSTCVCAAGQAGSQLQRHGKHVRSDRRQRHPRALLRRILHGQRGCSDTADDARAGCCTLSVH